MDEKDFIKRGRESKTPFAKWDELNRRYQGTVLWIKMARQFEFGTRNPKLDDEGNELMQMLICIYDAELGKVIVPVREGSDLHQKLAAAVAEAGAESPEPGGYLSACWIDERHSGAVTYKLFKVGYEPPPLADGDDSDLEDPFE